MNVDCGIVLMGMKHSGKSTIGRRLAAELAMPFVDLDDLLLLCAKRDGVEESVREVYRTRGAEAFAALELEAASSLDGPERSTGRNRIIALGGGTIENRQAMERLTPGRVLVYLVEDERILLDRVLKGGFPPFLIRSGEPEDVELAASRWHDLYVRRDSLYRQMATISVVLHGKDAREAFEMVRGALKEYFDGRQ